MLHIAVGTVRDRVNGNYDPMPLLGGFEWTETLTGAGTTTNATTEPTQRGFSRCAILQPYADCWVSWGTSPGDPTLTATPRLRLAAGVPLWLAAVPDGTRFRCAAV